MTVIGLPTSRKAVFAFHFYFVGIERHDLNDDKGISIGKLLNDSRYVIVYLIVY